MRVRLAFARTLASALLCLGSLPGCPGPEAASDAGSGVDASPRDAGSCTTAADCDDGLYCNGEEACDAGRCESGTAPDCDDGVACSLDVCSEERLRCESRAPDADGDGYGTATCVGAGGTPLGTDCDDADPMRYAGNVEVCDTAGHDEDCDETTFGGLDADGDGHVSDACCNDTATGTACGDDCSDTRASAFPMATEACNTVDDDCDDMVDEGVASTVYLDADRDGFGTGAAMMRCADSVGFSPNDGDCDDTPGTGIARSPGQPEICDGIRNDCSTTLVADAGASAVDWYRDVDGDGFGSAASGVVSSCIPVTGHSLRDTDCDDSTSSRSPAAAEQCNAVDDDCNGAADYAISTGDFEDDDADGIVDLSCGPPRGMDCDDTNPSTGPGTAESCDGRDNDCDTRVDEGATSQVYYRDLDMDGYGSAGSGTAVSCEAPAGYVARGGDCDDADALRGPESREACNGRDDDCDGASDESPAADRCPAMPRTAAAVCRAGACAPGRCDVGYADCNVDAVDGCETNVAIDAANCGSCGRSCGVSTSSTTYTCMPGGACGVVCSAGFSNCNGRADDGCEVAAATCPMCAAGFTDCDANATCEDLASDPLHCGVCGRSCGPGGACLGGRCDSFTRLATGGGHTCALREGGGVACWGDNALGQLGVAGATAIGPVEVSLAAPAIELVAGASHTCALLVDRRVECWGDNMLGQLGDASVPPAGVHVLPTLGGGASRIAAGSRHTVALLGMAGAVGWGDNAMQQISGVSGPASFSTPTTMTEVGAGSGDEPLALGGTFSCIGGGGGLRCLGLIPGGSITMMPYTWPADGPGFFFVDLAFAGDAHACVVTDTGTYCGGSPIDERLATSFAVAPGRLAPATFLPFGVASLGGASTVTCFRDTLDGVACSGTNADLALGRTGPSSAMPDTPTGLPRARALSSGPAARHVCAVDLAGRVWCWGANDARQADPTSGALRVLPTLVIAP